MGILDLHAPALESAAMDSRLYVPARQAPAFSVWDAAAAVPRGIVAGVGEMGASATEVVSGFYDAFKRLRDATPEQMREYERVGTLKPGDFRTEFGRAMRDEAQSWMPDPATTHASAQVIAEFSRMIGKVGVTVPFAGLVGGAAIVGAEEGFTTSDKLAQEGVDIDTRSSVGAITAGITAATFALPVAGKTLKSTAALALGGGPVAYIAQQQATREILNRADYSKLGDRYDPFDPVGLALSTLLPLGFGALGLRAANKAAAKAAADEAGRVAKRAADDAAAAEREFMAGPMPSEKTAVSRAIDAQMEDAARVSLLREVSDAHRLTPDDDLAGSAAHDAAMARAMEQIVAREPVDVTELVLSQTRERMALDSDIAAMETKRVDLVSAAADLADRGEVRQWRAELDALNSRAPQVDHEATQALAKQIQASSRLSFKKAFAEAERRIAELAADFTAKTDRIEQAIKRNAKAQQAVQDLAELDKRLATARERQAALPELRVATRSGEANQIGGQTFAEFVAKVDKAAREADAEARRLTRPAKDAAKAPAKEQAKEPAKPAAPPAKQTAEASAGIARAAADLEAVNPDLPVQLDGMDAPMPMSELMKRVKEEAAADLENAKLVEVAAACALRAAPR